MAESFLCLMADLDEGVQKNMSEWYAEIKKEGFTGTQTPNLPYHISLATYPLEMEEEVLANVKKVAAEFSQVEVDLSHIGMFAGGSVLFAAPDRNPQLDMLQEACQMGVPQRQLQEWLRQSEHGKLAGLVTTLRIEEAKRVLKQHPEWSTESVANYCGFSSREYFHRTFRQMTGSTPANYQ